MNACQINPLDIYGVSNLYHMTHIENLESILKYGLLPHGNPYQRQDISNCDVNNRRARKEPCYNRTIHSYVPFYFNPRNAMLYYNYMENKQNGIVLLAVKRELITSEGALFTDGNASSDHTGFSKDLSDLEKLHWECLYSDYWTDFPDGKRTKMAEVLVPDYVGMENVEGIICNNFQTKELVDKKIDNRYCSIVAPKFYF